MISQERGPRGGRGFDGEGLEILGILEISRGSRYRYSNKDSRECARGALPRSWEWQRQAPTAGVSEGAKLPKVSLQEFESSESFKVERE